MKLHIIFEEIERTRIKKKEFNLGHHEAATEFRDINHRKDYRGSGANGFVAKTKDGHEVIKNNHFPQPLRTERSDGYLEFIKMIDDEHNIHFPNISKAEIKHDDQFYMPKIHMEKLTEFSDVPFDMLKASIKRFVKAEDLEQCKKHDDLQYLFVELIQECLETGDFSKIKTKELHTALEILKHGMAHTDVALDMHMGNVMYRMSAFGAVPVIIDPFV